MTMGDWDWSDIWSDGEDDCKEQGMTTKPNPRPCEHKGCSNEAVFECEGDLCDGLGWVCSMHYHYWSDDIWADGEDDCKEQGMTTKPNSRPCEHLGCWNEAVIECEGQYCDGSGWVCGMHWKDLDTNYIVTGMGCVRCWQEVGIWDAWVVTVSDRRVPKSLSGEMAKCWNGCKDEETGDFIITLPIIKNDEDHDFCGICCTAWKYEDQLKDVEGEV